MVIVHMDKMSAPRERAQRLYEKNIELESRRRRSAQARIPSDPNAWQQMRENYEAIILEDHAFSEQHNIEYALWQLHYKRIEELRAHFSAALASTGSNSSQNVPTRPDRVSKIRLQFKTFLSEATGFYHDLILKIRAKYGLPLGYVSDDSDNRIVMEKEGNKSADIKKGIISCHRCLIYLGDLARYKGLYGESDSKSREYAAASGYYLQAASLWPASGNPHHQLAIIASYSGDELVAVYRYFRSLAAESPFSTARDNLIVAFEKNRQSYSQLPGNVKTSSVKESPARSSGKGRGKGETKIALKDASMEPNPLKGRESTLEETYKSFCIRFIRLNGILFTRTSLETFAEVLSLVNSGICGLLASGPEEELNFGPDAVENSLFIVRVISILIFTIHNVNKENEGQTYAEIVQRAVLLQNAHVAVFELMGCIFERCIQLRDPSSSFLLPGILVFIEWLACCPEIAASSDVEEKQASVRSKFWNLCISFFNKLLSTVPMSLHEDEDDTCFYNMSKYEEGETENRLALWEDFELRGFLPLLPAQTILDFSRKHSFGTDRDKEKSARIKRILAAGKALANVIRIDQKLISFDSKGKKFLIGVEPRVSDDFIIATSSGMSNTGNLMQETQAEKTQNWGVVQSNSQIYVEGEEEDEVIVFKPIVSEKRADVIAPEWTAYNNGLGLGQNAFAGDLRFHGDSVSSSLDNFHQQNAFDATSRMPASVSNIVPNHLQPIQSHALMKLSAEEEASLANSLKGLRFLENGHLRKSEMQKDIITSNSLALSLPIPQAMFYSENKPSETAVPSKIGVIASTVGVADNMAVNTNTASAMPTVFRKNPISRPVRHLGPPPGFSPVPPPKQVSEYNPGSEFKSENQIVDHYSWLDGYPLSSSTKGPGVNSIPYPSHSIPQQISNGNGLSGTVSFPFPGKQAPMMQLQMEKQKGLQDYQMPENLKSHNEQQLQQHQQLVNGNQRYTSPPEPYPGHSVWTGRYFV